MKKVIEVNDLCCERCARRLVGTLELSDGVLKAKANFKKNCIFVEVLSDFPTKNSRRSWAARGSKCFRSRRERGCSPESPETISDKIRKETTAFCFTRRKK